jgi:hypothetical protein
MVIGSDRSARVRKWVTQPWSSVPRWWGPYTDPSRKTTAGSWYIRA